MYCHLFYYHDDVNRISFRMGYFGCPYFLPQWWSSVEEECFILAIFGCSVYLCNLTHLLLCFLLQHGEIQRAHFPSAVPLFPIQKSSQLLLPVHCPAAGKNTQHQIPRITSAITATDNHLSLAWLVLERGLRSTL